MPFAKGQSGNPTGRPKVDQEVRELAREHGPAAITKLVELMEGEDKRLALSAAQALLDRGFGKPMQPLEHSGDADNPVHVVERRVVRPAD
jgi:hypothetical protein